jgi:outer membrane protein assembly factor BamB
MVNSRRFVVARRGLTVLILGALLSQLGALSPSANAPSVRIPPAQADLLSAVAPGPTQDWTTYHRSNTRTGVAAGIPAIHRLASAWARRLDGAVYGQPLVIGTVVVVATENNSVYGLARTTGTILWHANLGRPEPLRDLPCGNINPLGITGTPAYDPVTHTIFVATETLGAHHSLVALAASNGSVRWRQNLDVVAHRDRYAEQQRGALAVANGRVYVPFGGLYGDCGNYVGYVTTSLTTGRGGVAFYAVPTRREGGIWAASGVAVDVDGTVWVAVGNGASTTGRFDGSDSVLQLNATLSRRLAYFAPRTWGLQNANDQDLGSTGPILVGGHRAMVAGKDGQVYLLNTARLGGIGHPVATVSGCRGFGGLAYDPQRHLAFVPCDTGLLQVAVAATRLHRGWQTNSAIRGSPVVGAGRVWVLSASRGILYVLSETTGQIVAHLTVGSVTSFASPVLSGSMVFVGTTNGIVAGRIS